ncbi:Rrf2 family transcriptional regulator [bacterium]|nr:MAG: Rrf2 family transcriptional regulator [bacterium]
MATNCRFAFGVHVMSVLALNPEENYSSDTLGHTVNTNPVVIRRLLLDLKEAGLVETQRGPGGGAKLARAADEINLAQIYRAASGEVEPFGEHPHQPAQCCQVGREIKHVLERVSESARRAVEAEFEAVTLADVLSEIKNPVPL